MASKLRYGIIGMRRIGREHIENLRAMGGTEVTALADPSPASLRRPRRCRRPVQLFGDPRAF